MKEKPILFSGSMVRALLDGRKTQTRRIVKKQISERHNFQGWIIESTDRERDGCASWGVGEGALVNNLIIAKCPYGKPGDRLWVRETWQGPLFYDEIPEDWSSDKYKIPEYCYYKASGDSCDFTVADDNFVERWSPSIHMPRWASRILLEVINVRVERLNEISEDDAIAEGLKAITKDGYTIRYGLPDRDGYPGNDNLGWSWRDWNTSPILAYKRLWESINGKGSWDLNPHVWIIDLKPI